MRIVSYNVNGLRPRLLSRTLAAFLDSLDADIICLQETKIARHDLTADIAVTEGYESFFSCNRSFRKSRIGYSGVATFCRVGHAPSSTNPILPLAADEGFTGFLHRSQTGNIEDGKGRVGCYEAVAQTEMSMQELLQLDSEGRCLITDHGSFVLFNLYCPCVDPDDEERMKFKLNFFKTLQRRWEALLNQNRRIIAVGDFNISPYPVDSPAPGPQFDKNIFRRWFRSLLKHEGGPFLDVFRFFHPDRKEAYTCWNQSSGAEEFNYGSRIDLIIGAGFCNHERNQQATFDQTSHGFVECEVRDCDILTQFRRVKPGTEPRWQGGRTLKLEGSDHAPVYLHLKEQSPIEPHEAPPLAARFMPELRGRQQNLVALLNRNPASSVSELKSKGNDIVVGKVKKMQGMSSTAFKVKRQGVNRIQKSDSQQKDLRAFFLSSSQTKVSLTEEKTRHSKPTLYPRGSDGLSISDATSEQTCTESMDAVDEGESRTEFNLTNESVEGSTPDLDVMNSQGSYQAGSEVTNISEEQCTSQSQLETDCKRFGEIDIEQLTQFEQIRAVEDAKIANAAWSTIKVKMARAVPLCKGHDEPCVARVVKKPGPNIGRGFYVCARAEGPSSNPEARCDHFEWASSFKKGGKVVPQKTDSDQPRTHPRTHLKRIS